MSKEFLLGDVAEYVTEKISVNDISLIDYISTENLLPNKEGITLASGMPKAGKVTRYQAGDVLISNIRPYFKKIWFANRSGGASNDVLVFRSKVDTVTNKYLFYTLANDRFFDYSVASSKGSKMPRGDKVQIMRYPIKIPSVERQEKITDTLGVIDEKIELNRNINEALEQTGQLLFRHYFIDNPEATEWSISKIGKYYNVVLGGTPSRARPEYWKNGTVGWINSGKINEFRIMEPSEYITEDALHKSATKVLPAGTTVIAITGATLGQISKLEHPFAANQSVIGVVPIDNLSNHYIYYWIKHSIDKLIGRQTGGAQQHINRSDVVNFDLPLPSGILLKEFQNTIEPLSDLISKGCLEIQNLVTLRNVLLPQLINGESEI